MLTTALPAATLTHLQSRIVDHVRRHPRCTASQIQDGIKIHLDEGYLRHNLVTLTATGHLDRQRAHTRVPFLYTAA